VEECNRDGHMGSGHHHAGHGMCAVPHGIREVGIQCEYCRGLVGRGLGVMCESDANLVLL